MPMAPRVSQEQENNGRLLVEGLSRQQTARRVMFNSPRESDGSSSLELSYPYRKSTRDITLSM